VSSKRAALCIKAFNKISDRVEDIILVIGGEGPEKKRLKNLTKRLNLESKIKFVGYVKEEELWDYYACCDVFVHMDLAEFDIAPLEALALAKKVIWSTEMEIDEFLAGNRFIFPARPTVDDVAEILEKALNTDLATMSSREKVNLCNYTWNNCFNKMLRKIEKALG
jgi:glycosyltransferase involved in cell wall biosynthesis